MNDVKTIEDRLRATLRTKSNQVEVPSREFRPDAIAVVELTAPRRPRRRPILVAAAVAATIVVAASALVVTSRGTKTAGHVRVRPAGAPGTNQGPAGPALVPSDVPSGLDLWGMNTQAAPSRSELTAVFTSQLFGVVDASGAPSPGILVRMQPAPPGGMTLGEPVTVRGASGASSAPKEAVATSENISWVEGGQAIAATIRGLSRADAIAALDSLHPRGANLVDGFDAGAYPLLGETLAKDAGHASVGGMFDYARGPQGFAGGPPLSVRTDTHADYPGYLGFWIEGRRGSDGSVVKRDPGWGLDVAWSDGRQVLVSSKTDDWPTLERIARSVSLQPVSALTDLEDGVNGRLAALPRIDSAQMQGVNVTLRGQGQPATLCIAVGTTERCGSPFAAQAGGSTKYQVSALVDGTWHLVVASQVPVRIRHGVSGPSPDIAQHSIINGWSFAFAALPPDVTQVTVDDGPDFTQGFEAQRPDF